jgi:hypothetical protein
MFKCWLHLVKFTRICVDWLRKICLTWVAWFNHLTLDKRLTWCLDKLDNIQTCHKNIDLMVLVTAHGAVLHHSASFNISEGLTSIRMIGRQWGVFLRACLTWFTLRKKRMCYITTKTTKDNTWKLTQLTQRTT